MSKWCHRLSKTPLTFLRAILKIPSATFRVLSERIKFEVPVLDIMITPFRLPAEVNCFTENHCKGVDEMTVWIGSTALAAVVAFFIGAAWYSVLFGATYEALRPGGNLAAAAMPSAAVMVMEFVRCLVVAAALAYLINRLAIVNFRDALILAIVVWGGFQLVGLIGSVLHEGYSVKLYAIHMGDALAKVIASSFIITGLTSRFA